MPTYNKITISAFVIVAISLLIVSLPNAEGMTTNTRSINDMRLTLSWGDVNDSLPITKTQGWDGALTLSGGIIKVLHPLQFKDSNDRLLDTMGEQIHFQSDINSDYDGLQLRLFPSRVDEAPTLYFDSAITGRVSFPLSEVATNKTYTKNFGASGSVLIELGDVNYNKGSIAEQINTTIANEKARCMQASAHQEDCLAAAEQKSVEITFQGTIKKLSALTLEKNNVDMGTLSSKINPDYLNFLGSKQLEHISRADLAKYDFSKLTFLSNTLYLFLKNTAPEYLSSLPSMLQDRVATLEGKIPLTLANQMNISSSFYSRLAEILSQMSELDRTNVAAKMKLLTPARWHELEVLSTEDLQFALHMLAVLQDEKVEVQFKNYIAQLSHIRALIENFHQIEPELSTTESNLLKDAFSSIQAVLIDDNLVSPSLYKQYSTFFSEISVLSKEKRTSSLSALMLSTKTVLTESKKTKVQEGTLAFSDSEENLWFHAYVQEAFMKKIVSGYSDKNGKSLHMYHPENKVSVAELLKMSLESAGIGEETGTPSHKEATSHWAKAYVKRAESLHMSLVAGKTIDLNRPATRGEVIKSIFEAYGYLPSDPTEYSFSDVKAATPGANYIYFAKDLGIISGDDGSTNFRPYDSINRAEVAKILIQTLLAFKNPLNATQIGGDLAQ